jgi:hypothetical protein
MNYLKNMQEVTAAQAQLLFERKMFAGLKVKRRGGHPRLLHVSL